MHYVSIDRFNGHCILPTHHWKFKLWVFKWIKIYHTITKSYSFYRFLPLVSLIVFMIGYSIGFGTIPFLLMGEILPAAQRSLLSSVAGSFNLGAMFVVIKTYHPFESVSTAKFEIDNWFFKWYSFVGNNDGWYFLVVFGVKCTRCGICDILCTRDEGTNHRGNCKAVWGTKYCSGWWWNGEEEWTSMNKYSNLPFLRKIYWFSHANIIYKLIRIYLWKRNCWKLKFMCHIFL